MTLTSLYLINFIDKPSSPRNLAITGYTKDSISVSWTAPDSDGGSPLVSYAVERRDAKRNTWMTAGSTKPDEMQFTVTKLIDGNEYLIRVFAENDVGASEPAESEPTVAKMPFGKNIYFSVCLQYTYNIVFGWDNYLSYMYIPNWKWLQLHL